MHNQQTLKLFRNIDTIQFHSLEAFRFTFPVISLSYICFLSIKAIIFRAKVKPLVLYNILRMLHGYRLFSEEIFNEYHADQTMFF